MRSPSISGCSDRRTLHRGLEATRGWRPRILFHLHRDGRARRWDFTRGSIGLIDDHQRGAAGRRIERHLAPEEVAALPAAPGVYLMRNERGDLLYVGKARRLKDRVGSYFNLRASARRPPISSAMYGKIETSPNALVARSVALLGASATTYSRASSRPSIGWAL